MNAGPHTPGKFVRSLLDPLDTDVAAADIAADLDWRPRFTPVPRALTASGPTSIKALALAIGVSHPAVSQTVSQMAKDGLMALAPGADARERIVFTTSNTASLVPALERQWAASNAAADQSHAELSASLTALLMEAAAALDQRPFGARMAAALAPAPTP
jgi:DNA-binding MarR family transcriptional regulator